MEGWMIKCLDWLNIWAAVSLIGYVHKCAISMENPILELKKEVYNSKELIMYSIVYKMYKLYFNNSMQSKI